MHGGWGGSRYSKREWARFKKRLQETHEFKKNEKSDAHNRSNGVNSEKKKGEGK